MFIKKYNQFVKTKVNEDIDLPEDTINGNPELASEEDVEMEVNDMDDSDDMGITGENEYQEIENATEEEEEMEEEGGAYIGQKMIQDLADALDVQPDADGSVTYNGKKINFYSETEKFHVDKKKFSSVEEVVNYLNGDVESTATPEDIRRDELEAEDDRALLSTEEEDEIEMEPETKFESKSYKFTRKFNNFR